MSGDTMRTVTNKRRCEVAPADDDNKEETPMPKTPRRELKKFKAAGPVDACEVSATLQAHSFGSSKNNYSCTRKITDRGQMQRAVSVKNVCVVDAMKMLSKSRPPVFPTYRQEWHL
ncbi:hypothetical protein MRX96_001371 [Rhipicephalus microplus]